jgi:GNAT superfamily N-acetyltransferase
MTRAKKPSVRVHGLFHAEEPNAGDQHFSENRVAQDHYEAHRSAGAPVGTQTFHLLVDEHVAGFISWRVAYEDDADTRAVFVSIEYLYIKEAFRGRMLSKVLVESLIREVQAQVIRAFYFRGSKTIYIHSTSAPISRAGDRVLHAFEHALTDIARRYRGTKVIGRHREYPK